MRRVSQCSASRTSPITGSSTLTVSVASLCRARERRLSAHDRRRAGADERIPAAARHRDSRAAHGAPFENAREVADSLRADPRVAWVDYAGFVDSPYYTLVQKYLSGRAPSLLTFGVGGGLEAAKAFYDALGLVKRLVNIGDTRTLCCHPASTTHRQMTPEGQLLAGVRPETIRLSVGIEHVQDILDDLDQALRFAVTNAS